jgi:hypothetical protein
MRHPHLLCDELMQINAFVVARHRASEIQACVLCDAWAEALITSNSIAFTQTVIWRGFIFTLLD